MWGRNWLNIVALITYSRNFLLPGNIWEILSLCCFSKELWKKRSSTLYLVAPSQQQPVFIAMCSHAVCPALSGLPEVKITASQDKILEGGNLTFICEVEGSPTLTVRWQTEALHSHFFTKVAANCQHVLNKYKISFSLFFLGCHSFSSSYYPRWTGWCSDQNSVF